LSEKDGKGSRGKKGLKKKKGIESREKELSPFRQLKLGNGSRKGELGGLTSGERTNQNRGGRTHRIHANKKKEAEKLQRGEMAEWAWATESTPGKGGFPEGSGKTEEKET